MNELVFFDLKGNTFVTMKPENKSVLLQNTLSDLVNLESVDDQIAKIEDFKYFNLY